jgi:N-acetylmuramoyl-L-alanine amidase
MRKLFFVFLFLIFNFSFLIANDSLDYCPLPLDTIVKDKAVVIRNQSPILIVLDPAHGSDTPGKRSPEANKLLKKNSSEPVDSALVFFEYEFSREIISNLESLLDSVSIYHIRSSNSLKEVGLNKRVYNTNYYASLWKSNPKKLFSDSAGTPSMDSVLKYPKSRRLTFFLSPHNNAAGYGVLWENARGFSVWTSRHYTYSDIAADITLEEFQKEFPEIKIIGSLESNFRVLMCKPYAVLIECLFQDNKKDVVLLNSPDFKLRYTYVLLRSIIRISTLLTDKY